MTSRRTFLNDIFQCMFPTRPFPLLNGEVLGLNKEEIELRCLLITGKFPLFNMDVKKGATDKSQIDVLYIQSDADGKVCIFECSTLVYRECLTGWCYTNAKQIDKDGSLIQKVIVKAMLMEIAVFRQGFYSREPHIVKNCEEDGLRELLISRIIQIAGGHPNIVKLFNIIDHDEQTIYKVEEYGGEQLYKHCILARPEGFKFTQTQTRIITYQLLSAINWLHGKEICHLDISLDNIAFEIDKTGFITVKLFDFGQARFLIPNEDGTFYSNFGVGVIGKTNKRLTPEISSVEEVNGVKADIYCIGAVMYRCLTGFFNQSTPYNDEINHNDGFINPVLETELVVRDLLSRMLARDPSARLTIKEIMEHKWFQLKKLP